MNMGLNKKWKQFEDWFDLHCGYYLTNGNKVEAREKRLREKFNIQTNNTDLVQQINRWTEKPLETNENKTTNKDKF
tara:strand:+ start:419 stop:646 length:228 start_codon:yes stop_codon:yes gene_type:complete